MRYRLGFCPNPDVLLVHVDKMIIRTSIEHYASPEEGSESSSNLVRDLFGIEGVTELFLKPHVIHLEKGKVFDWKEMISAILSVVQDNLDPEGGLTESTPPTRSYVDGRGCSREQPLNLPSQKGPEQQEKLDQ